MNLSVNKIFINSIKGLIALFLLVILVLEAFLTAPYISYDITVIYTAIITTLCWLLIGWLFMHYSYFQYFLFFIAVIPFLYLYCFDVQIKLAHQQERCVDLGQEWDKEQNFCRIN